MGNNKKQKTNGKAESKYLKRKAGIRNQGITLIALVITIIILLILAAITINLTLRR